MWDTQNDVKHNAISAVDQRRIDELDGLIREQFRKGQTNLLRWDFHWISGHIHVVLNYPLDVKEKWMQSVTLARENIADQLENSIAAAQQRATFAQWFVPRT